MNILVIEDDQSMRQLTEDILGDEDHEVFTAVTAREAFEILKTKPIEFIVTDLMLPDVSGLDLLYQLRQTKLPVTIITGLSKDVVIEELLSQLGIAGVLQKPFTPDTLLGVIDKGSSS